MVYGANGQSQMYVYHHEEDESTFQLVDTSRPQRPIHYKPKGRQMQVCKRNAYLYTYSLSLLSLALPIL